METAFSVIPYSAIIGQGKISGKNSSQKIGGEIFAVLNKTICAYIIIFCNVPEKIECLRPCLTACAVGNSPICLNLL